MKKNTKSTKGNSNWRVLCFAFGSIFNVLIIVASVVVVCMTVGLVESGWEVGALAKMRDALQYLQGRPLMIAAFCVAGLFLQLKECVQKHKKSAKQDDTEFDSRANRGTDRRSAPQPVRRSAHQRPSDEAPQMPKFAGRKDGGDSGTNV